jgi:hypothetical protein
MATFRGSRFPLLVRLFFEARVCGPSAGLAERSFSDRQHLLDESLAAPIPAPLQVAPAGIVIFARGGETAFFQSLIARPIVQPHRPTATPSRRVVKSKRRERILRGQPRREATWRQGMASSHAAPLVIENALAFAPIREAGSHGVQMARSPAASRNNIPGLPPAPTL